MILKRSWHSIGSVGNNIVKSLVILIVVLLGIVGLSRPSLAQGDNEKIVRSVDAKLEKSSLEVAALFAWPVVALAALLVFQAQLKDLMSSFANKDAGAGLEVFGFKVTRVPVQNTEQFKAQTKDAGDKPVIFGDPNAFRLLCKASNSRVSKSTKVLNLENGCLIQVSTREVLSDNSVAVAEALAFVPDLNATILEMPTENSSDIRVAATFCKVERENA